MTLMETRGTFDEIALNYVERRMWNESALTSRFVKIDARTVLNLNSSSFATAPPLVTFQATVLYAAFHGFSDYVFNW
jgi:hypothetical protein